VAPAPLRCAHLLDRHVAWLPSNRLAVPVLISSDHESCQQMLLAPAAALLSNLPNKWCKQA